jgi:cobalt-zinc-cadmium efflux system protein
MAHAHDHVHIYEAQNEKRLWWALGLTASFLIVEVIGGWVTGSLALLSDAAHMFTDTAALAIALAAVRLARRPADNQRTYGYYRFEILAAAFNALLLFAVAMYIIYEAVVRINNPPELHTGGMLLVATAGLVVNLIAVKLLSGGQSQSMNVRGAYLEALADLVGSVGVIIGALIIWWTQWWWVDSLIAVGIGLWVLPRTWVLLRDSLHILLEGVPESVNVEAIRLALSAVDGVESIHDLHVWSLTSQKVTLTVHVVCPARSAQAVLDDAMAMLSTQFNIHHVAIQCEQSACAMTRPEGQHYQPHQ